MVPAIGYPINFNPSIIVILQLTEVGVHGVHAAEHAVRRRDTVGVTTLQKEHWEKAVKGQVFKVAISVPVRVRHFTHDFL